MSTDPIETSEIVWKLRLGGPNAAEVSGVAAIRLESLEAERKRLIRNRDMWKGQSERQAANLHDLRMSWADADRRVEEERELLLGVVEALPVVEGEPSDEPIAEMVMHPEEAAEAAGNITKRRILTAMRSAIRPRSNDAQPGSKAEVRAEPSGSVAPSPIGCADEVEAMRGRLSYRLNDWLCEMKPDHDDSIVGFNEAWDVVRKFFDDEVMRAQRKASDEIPVCWVIPNDACRSNGAVDAWAWREGEFTKPLYERPSPPVQERQEVGDGEFKPDWTLTETERAIVALSLALPKHIPNWPGCTDEQMEAVATSALAELHREPQPVGGSNE